MNTADEHIPLSAGEGLIKTHIPVPDTPAGRRISAQIAREGRIPYSMFMGISNEEYYRSVVTIGSERDFSTSPEKSPLFGASIAEGAYRVWEAMGSPEQFQFLEIGAGTGATAKAFLDWAKQEHPDFYESLSYTIYDVSDTLIAQQKDTLRDHQVGWEQGESSVFGLLEGSEVEGVIFSNEVFDVYGVERVRNRNGVLEQLYVTVENGEWVEQWDEPDQETVAHMNEFGITISDGQEEPINTTAVELQHHLGRALRKGAIISIDYGRKKEVAIEKAPAVRVYGKPEGRHIQRFDTAAAYRWTGQVDMTSSVNFRILEDIAVHEQLGISYSGTQDEFLRAAGMTHVLDVYGRRAREAQTWGEIVSLSRIMRSYQELWVEPRDLKDREPFYVSVQTKGMPQEVVWDTDASKNYEPAFRKIAIETGRPHLKVGIGTEKGVSLGWPEDVVTDEQGILYLNADTVAQGVRIYDHVLRAETELANLGDDQTLRDVLAKNGIRVEANYTSPLR